MSNEYQVIARKYRPQSFSQVLGQEPIVTTLVNALKHDRLAHAYLFCGCRGTGKTTLARIFAKALNCAQPGENFEPCNQCSPCKEISHSQSLDVLEIDGASHRGIDDIRQINETVGYAPSAKYKVFIIDEVHMLTKEAFNALLKTLEEPPEKVKFLFATTEVHKVPATILSRCQRFNLARIPAALIQESLGIIAKELGVEIAGEALALIAQLAEGSLRDAQSLLDQLISFQGEQVSLKEAQEVFAVASREQFFALDQAAQAGDVTYAFTLGEEIFSQGKDIPHFLSQMIEHFRTHLLLKNGASQSLLFYLSEEEKKTYLEINKNYSQAQCLDALDLLQEAQQGIRFSVSPRVALEALLCKLIRQFHRISLEALLGRLGQLETAMGQREAQAPAAAAPAQNMAPPPKQASLNLGIENEIPPTRAPKPAMPSPAPVEAKPPAAAAPKVVSKAVAPKSAPPPQKKEVSAPAQPISHQERARLDTLIQFTKTTLDAKIESQQVIK